MNPEKSSIELEQFFKELSLDYDLYLKKEYFELLNQLDNRLESNLCPTLKWIACAFNVISVLSVADVSCKGYLKEVLNKHEFFKRAFCGVEDSSIDQHQKQKYICSILFCLRMLLQNACILSGDSGAPDIGTVLKLIDGEFSADTERQAISFLCEYLNLPNEFKVDALQRTGKQKEANDTSLSKWILDDVAEVSSLLLEASSSLLNATTDHIVSHKSMISICGYCLRSTRTSEWKGFKFVQTATSVDNMRSLAQAVLVNRPTIVQGTIGCGKSYLIRELAAAMGVENTLIELQVSDQTDIKTLIGSYVCSDVPGEFVWQSGIITQAVLNGYWLVVESIDRVPLEFVASISTLLEFNRLYLPHRDTEIDAHPNFRIFGTRNFSTEKQITHKYQTSMNSGSSTAKADPSASFVDYNSLIYVSSLRHFSHLFQFVIVYDCTLTEVSHIITTLYPRILPTVAQKLLKVYHMLSGDVNNKSYSSSIGEIDLEVPSFAGNAAVSALSFANNNRKMSLRELLQAAARIDQYSATFNHVSGHLTDEQKRLTLSEVVDVFAGSIRSKLDFEEVVLLLGMLWGVSETEVKAFILHSSPHQPEFNINNSSSERVNGCVKVGRATLAVNKSDVLGDPNQSSRTQNFAFTKHALRVLERVAVCVSMGESVLLVGETGSGKTTTVQELADMTGRRLIVQNLSLSTDVSDLLGGFRPVTMKQLFLPVYETFVRLFSDTFELNNGNNNKFIEVASGYFQKKQWKKLLGALRKACVSAKTSLKAGVKAETDTFKLSQFEAKETLWWSFDEKIARYQANLSKIEFGFAFAFVDGLLVNALKNGYWVLLDEINLAAPETLQSLSGILDNNVLFISEGDASDMKPIVRHPDFRVFAAMNPPTDVGKKELPSALRSRFTEIFSEEMTDPQDIAFVVEKYLMGIDSPPIEDIVRVYLECRDQSEQSLVDSAGQRPRYSLRSLTRSLRAARSFLAVGIKPLFRSLYEAFLLNFQTLLGGTSREKMQVFLQQRLYSNTQNKELDSVPSRPGGRKSTGADWVLVKPFWLQSGPLSPVDWAVPDNRGSIHFVLNDKTPTIEKNIRDIAAAVAANVAPILLQGPTSVGKTTMIEYLAARTGHKCVRINNHEHTDVQEYIGGYFTNASGQLEFRDGLLVESLRMGHWIILDELNLAPSDILEALNRLLDDNKELLIPETGEIVKPAPGFCLFATQNPPGVYGGRKPLSRAFRNRFLELSVTDLPLSEVEVIIAISCGIAPKFAGMLVKCMHELQIHRQSSALFGGKHGSVTVRDLIKWGRRKPQNALEVAQQGYMILAEKLRTADEQIVVETILNTVCKVELCSNSLYDDRTDASCSVVSNDSQFVRSGTFSDLYNVQQQLRCGGLSVEGVRGVAITAAFRRMWLLVSASLANSEPTLLIGETGCGKTTICQLIASQENKRIRILNCHQATESSDIIGGLRPVRGRESIRAAVVADIHTMITYLVALKEKRRAFYTASEDIQDSIIVEPSSAESMSGVKVKLFLTAISEEQQVDDIILNDSLDELSGELSTVHLSDGRESPVPLKKMRIDSSSAVLVSTEEAFEIQVVLTRAKSNWLRYKSLFEWQDGPLILAMKEGDYFLIDEINLADDAVIERLNSVLEGGRSITLAEKGSGEAEKIVAHPNFRFLATMNPSGDFGKRELSPALRSRFTEIWVPNNNNSTDIELIVSEMLHFDAVLCEVSPGDVALSIIEFMEHMNSQSSSLTLNGIKMSVREVLAWAKFISQSSPVNKHDVYAAYLHGAHMIMLDGLGIGLTASRENIRQLKASCVAFLLSQCPVGNVQTAVAKSVAFLNSSASIDFIPMVVNNRLSVGSFSVPVGPHLIALNNDFIFNAKNTTLNMGRILRAMQLPRPILLEGPPGVGKSSLIENLAKLSGNKLVRINLSEHSEISDLLGSDLPVSADDTDTNSTTQKIKGTRNSDPKFKWFDGVFLSAMKSGSWVLLDELNLAPQSVLEGLNACFDHREEVFLPEIGMSVKCPSTFRVFCAQNPMVEGGGRKGLPQSFLSRFSRVFVESMSEDDLLEIVTKAFIGRVSELSQTSGRINGDDKMDVFVETSSESAVVHMPHRKFSPSQAQFIAPMIHFIQRLQRDVVETAQYGRLGGPWEFNLRDVFRWCELLETSSHSNDINDLGTEKEREKYIVVNAAYILFYSRMRSTLDRAQICVVFFEVFGFPLEVDLYPAVIKDAERQRVNFGLASLSVAPTPKSGLRHHSISHISANSIFKVKHFEGVFAKTQEMLAYCISLHWPVLLVGKVGSGKRKVVQYLSDITGNRLKYYSASPSTDSTELLGSFEQINPARHLFKGMELLNQVTVLLIMDALSGGQSSQRGGIADAVSHLSKMQIVVQQVTYDNALKIDAGKRLFEDLRSLLQALWVLSSQVSSPEMGVQLQLLLESVLVSINKASDGSSQTSSGFEWVDGIVVKAVEQGHWLVIDNVNLCSASVLDRLNSLLEPKGTLLLTESGTGRVVKPHKDFRMFLMMDPTLGEISRAMRNRCVEIAMVNTNSEEMFSCDLNTVAFMASQYSANDFEINRALLQLFRLLSAKNQQQSDFMNISSVVQLPDHFPRYRLFDRVCQLFKLNLSCKRTVPQAFVTALHAVLPNYSVPPSLSLLTEYAGSTTMLQRRNSCALDRAINFSYISQEVWVLLTIATVLSCCQNSKDICTSAVEWFDVVLTNSKCHAANVASLFHESMDSCAPLVPSVSDLLLRSAESDVDRMRVVHAIVAQLARATFASSDVTQAVVHTSLSGLNLAKLYLHWLQLSQTAFAASPLVVYVGENRTQEANQLTLQVIRNRFRIARNSAALYALHVVSPELWWEYLQVALFNRCVAINAEHSAKEQSQKVRSYGYENATDLSLYSLGHALHAGWLSDDCKELHVIASLHNILTVVDAFVKRVVALHKVSVTAQHLIEWLSLLRELLLRRDLLSNVLCSEVFVLNSRQLPWNEIAVTVRWLRKAIRSIVVYFTELQAIVGNTFQSVAHDLLYLSTGVSDDISHFDRVASDYFRQVITSEKIRLWKEGGHAAVPSQRKDWVALFSLLEVSQPLSELMPSFVNTVVNKRWSEVRCRDSTTLLKEWLCLYSTFYYAFTNESTIVQKATAVSTMVKERAITTVDIVALTAALKLRFDEYVKSKVIEINSSGSDYEMTCDTFFDGSDSQLLQFDQTIHSHIQREVELAGEQSITVIAESLVLRQLNEVSTELAFLLSTNFSSLTKEFISHLVLLIDAVLKIALRYTSFEVKLFRELQSLLWCFEALHLALRHQDAGLFDQHKASLVLLIRISVVTLESRIASMTVRNLSNNLHVVRFAYTSSTLSAIVNTADAEGGRSESGSSSCQAVSMPLMAVVMSGAVRLHQPVVTELLLHHLDAKLLFPQYQMSDGGCAGIMRLLSTNTAIVTVSSKDTARTKILQLFRMGVSTSFKTAARGGDTAVNRELFSEAKICLLCVFAWDVVIACRDFYTLETAVAVRNIRQQQMEQSLSPVEQFVALSTLHISNNIRCEPVAILLQKCLQPVLLLLANRTVHIDPLKNFVAVSLAWVQIGILRAQLALPAMPVDPALKPIVKSNLLIASNNVVQERLSVETAARALSDTSLITPQTVNCVAALQQSFAYSLILQNRGVQRPEETVGFDILFDDLRDASEGLVGVDRVLSLAERLVTGWDVFQSHAKCHKKNDKTISQFLERVREAAKEEVAWQGSLLSLCETLENKFRAYEDITSPLLSAFANISTGLRLLSGWIFSHACDLAQLNENVNTVGTNSRGLWKHLLSYPFGSSVALTNSGAKLNAELLAPISEILEHHDILSVRAIENMTNAQKAAGDDSFRSDVPDPKSVMPMMPHIVLLHTLSRIDYLVGGGSLPISTVYPMFASALTKLIEVYLEGLQEKKYKEAQRDAMFVNRAQEKIFLSNDSIEEETSLRTHFPNHLRDLVEISGAIRGPDGNELSFDKFLAQEDDHEGQDTTNDSKDTISSGIDGKKKNPMLGAVELFQTFDETTAIAVIGYHVRMVFLYLNDQMLRRNRIWTKRNVTPAGFNGTSRQNRNVVQETVVLSTAQRLTIKKRRLQSALCLTSLLTAKALDWSLRGLFAPGLDGELRGGTLMMLSLTVDKCSSVDSLNSGHSTFSILPERCSLGEIDRDLMLLLNEVGGNDSDCQPLNFHLDANPSEVIKATGPLSRMFNRATQVLITFPGNEFLMQVCKVSGKIAEFHLTTPLGKMLISLELLLRKAQEWEVYAAKHVSLRVEMDELSVLIQQWRQIELKSWENLLRTKEVSYVKRAMLFWFSLAKIFNSIPENLDQTNSDKKNTVFGWATLNSYAPEWLHKSHAKTLTASAVDQKVSLTEETDSVLRNTDVVSDFLLTNQVDGTEMTESVYLKTIFEIVDGFLRTATVGEFPTRLHLVRLFSLQLLQENPMGIKLKLANLSYGVWQYYNQFLPSVRTFQDTLKAPIQERLKGEVKIGRWDQMTTYALIEHSERVHRKLNKFIREYAGDVLDFPVTALLRKEIMSDLISDAGELQTSTTVPGLIALFPFMNKIGDSADFIGVVDKEEEIDDSSARIVVDETLTELGTFTLQSEDISFPVAFVEKLKSSGSAVLSNLGLAFRKAKFIDRELKKLLVVDITLSEREERTQRPKVPATESCVEPEVDYATHIFNNKACYGVQAAYIAEGLCGSIFARIKSLQEDCVTKQMKTRAVNDLLSELKDQGVSCLRHNAGEEIRHNLPLLLINSPLSMEFASDFSWCALSPRDLLEKAEVYFIRNVAEISQLRAQSQSVMNKDISRAQSIQFVGLSENMLNETLKIRCSIGAALCDYQELMTSYGDIDTLTRSAHAAVHTSTKFSFKHTVELSSAVDANQQVSCVMLDNLVQLQTLLETAVVAHRPEHVELECALKVVSGSDAVKALTALKSVTRLIALVCAPEEVNRRNLSIYSLTNVSHHICIENCSALNLETHHFMNSDVTIDNNKVLVQQLTYVTQAQIEFNKVSLLLSDLVSSDVVAPIVARFDELINTVTNNSNIVNNAGCATASSNGAVTVDEMLATKLTGCVEKTLFAVQHLTELANANKVLAGQSKVYKTDCFGQSLSNRYEDVERGVKLKNCVSLGIAVVCECRVKEIAESLTAVATHLYAQQSCDPQCLNSSLLMLDSTLSTVRRLIGAYSFLLSGLIGSYKSTSKLLYVILRVFRTLLAKGICSAETNEDGDGNGDGAGNANTTFHDNVDGTGMGEGEGNKDVSDQIDNEEQLLGLKNDPLPLDGANEKKKQEKKTLEEKEKDTGVEMEQDFEGEMFDIPKDGDDDRNEDSESEDDENHEQPEREMGDANMEDIIDEKQWNEEEEKDNDDNNNNQNKEKFEKDSKMNGDALEDEMRTKDDLGEEDQGEDEDGDRNNPKETSKPAGSDDEGDGADQNENAHINEDLEEDYMEKPLSAEVRENENQQNVENEQQGDDDGDAGEESATPDESANRDTELPEDMQLDAGEKDLDTVGEEENKESEPAAEAAEDVDDNMSVDSQHENRNETDPDENLTASMGASGLPDQEEDLSEQELADPPVDTPVSDENKPAAFGVRTKMGQESVLESHPQDEESGGADQSKAQGPKGSGNSTNEGSGKDGESFEIGGQHRENDASESKQRKQQPPNPFTQRGDVNEKWHRRLNLIPTVEEDNETENEDVNLSSQDNSVPPDGHGKGLYEHADKNEAASEQALANAEEDEAVQLPDHHMNSGNEENKEISPENDKDNQCSDNDKKRDRGEKDEKKAHKRTKLDLDRSVSDRLGLDDDLDHDVDRDGSDTDSLGGEQLGGEESDENNGENDEESKQNPWYNGSRSFCSSAKLDSREQSDLQIRSSEDVDLLESVVGESRDLTAELRGKELWLKHRVSTEASSVRLCEQLRLILEPTLATRLQGDYRTGKRINMRKVISYVASGFRKDKIWLRRTKPAKRDYQVMIMIDDSSSMGAAGPLAMSAMATIANALTRLEVGELCVASFAENVKILHPFDRPFSDIAGAQILSKFDFTAGRTMLGASLEKVLPVFEKAREMSGSASQSSSCVTVQLCFVISDARIDSDNRERLDNIVRTMAEQHILVVLVIIDANRNMADSVFNTRTVSFVGNKIVTGSYFDNFPFPFYVAIQNAEALPEVLSFALKQWFELVKSQTSA